MVISGFSKLYQARSKSSFVKVRSMQIGIDTLGLTVMSIKFKATIQDEEAADAQKDHF